MKGHWNQQRWNEGSFELLKVQEGEILASGMLGLYFTHKDNRNHSRYSIDHIPTGFKVRTDLRYKAAVKMVKALSAFNWSFIDPDSPVFRDQSNRMFTVIKEIENGPDNF